MVLAYRVMTLSRGYKITRNQFSSLVNKLIKSMLAVRSWLSPDNWPCLIINILAITINVLTIALHISLLEICCKAMHVLVIRQNSFTFRIREIIIPYPQYPHDISNIRFKLTPLKMNVSRLRAF